MIVIYLIVFNIKYMVDNYFMIFFMGGGVVIILVCLILGIIMNLENVLYILLCWLYRVFIFWVWIKMVFFEK